MPPKRAADSQTSNTNAKKSKGSTGWSDDKDLIVYVPECAETLYREKMAGFDIDGTIITTKSGKVFAQNSSDWRLLYKEVPIKLEKLWKEENTRIVFFTNQAGLAKGKVKLPELKTKFEAIMKQINCPITILISPGAKSTRKPHRGMWEALEQRYSGAVKVDRSSSVFVGDAAGRVAHGVTKKDFSCSDRLFAMNVGVAFRTPEEFFLGQRVDTVKYTLPEFNPKTYIESIKTGKLLVDLGDGNQLIGDKQPEIVVMAGGPASGKSHFARNHLVSAGYEWVNRDTLKTWQKCVAAAQQAVKSGKSVVVDNTNPDKESRARYVKVAKDAKVPCRCFTMQVNKPQAKHNNVFRLICGADKAHQDVNDMVMNMHYSKFVKPTKAEGFDQVAVIGVNFIPEFEDDSERQIYEQFLLEK